MMFSLIWHLGQSVEPMKVENVTMLFSDIVGFTAICATCTPIQIVNMLNSLYTHFDNFCGVLDIYKVRQRFVTHAVPSEGYCHCQKVVK